jgi:hypothetical protein
LSFASVGTLGSAQSKTSTTTVVVTTGATAEAGNLVIVESAWDNTDTSDGETTRLSVADSASNTWTKIAEYTDSEGSAAADGATVAVWFSVLDNQLGSGGTITVTSTDARVAKAANAWEFTIDEDAVLVQDYVTLAGGTGGNPGPITISDLPSREYLMIHALASERTQATTFTQDADYTDITWQGTTGGATNDNMRIIGGFRIATLTGDTVDVEASTSAAESAQILAAIYEDAEAEPIPGTYSPQNHQQHRWYGGQPIA